MINDIYMINSQYQITRAFLVVEIRLGGRVLVVARLTFL